VRAPLDDTIVAPATAAGEAGLAVVRVTGPAALAVGAALFRGADLRASDTHHAHHGFAVDASGEYLDEVLALVLHAPHGYTGEDTVEISCHGSPQVVEEIVAAALAAGARLAEPGEFTRRAFLNGKLDLCQAEAVADLIAAQSRAARRSALEQLRGQLSARLHEARGDLLRLLADVEASIDFVEEGLEFFGREAAGELASRAAARLDALLDTAGDGMLLRAGVQVSLAGAPNVGKSSLFNRILRSPRSIVTEHPGTTRDVVRETVRLGGLAFVLEDTAGLRESTQDPVEAIGIERSRRSHADADVVLHVLHVGHQPEPHEAREILALDPERTLVVLNKIDLLPETERVRLAGGGAAARTYVSEMLDAVAREPADAEARVTAAVAPSLAATRLPECVAVSAVTGAGIEALLEALLQLGRLRRLGLQNDALVAINQRHREVLLRALRALAIFDSDLHAGEPPEILAADLRSAVTALGEVSGEQVTEEILDAIFARFCIGK
jgi:tRNA modification GTPase